MTPFPSPRYLPCAGFLFNFKLTVFLIFSVLLSRRLGVGGGENQYSVAGDLEACELQGMGPERCALQPWAGDHGSYLQRPRAGHRFRSGARVEKQGIYCLRTKLGNKFHAAPGEPHILCSSFFLPSCILMASSLLSHLTALLTPLPWYTGSEPVIMPTLQIWVRNISTAGSVIIR